MSSGGRTAWYNQFLGDSGVAEDWTDWADAAL